MEGLPRTSGEMPWGQRQGDKSEDGETGKEGPMRGHQERLGPGATLGTG